MNKFNINTTCYVWDLEKGLPTIRRLLIFKIELVGKEIFYSGYFQYEEAGDPDIDYGFVDKKYSQDHVFISEKEAKKVAFERG
jgi:hypothetical protein